MSDIIDKICDIMKFDPKKKTYDKEKGKYFMEWRKKRVEELGISIGKYNAGKVYQNYEISKDWKEDI